MPYQHSTTNGNKDLKTIVSHLVPDQAIVPHLVRTDHSVIIGARPSHSITNGAITRKRLIIFIIITFGSSIGTQNIVLHLVTSCASIVPEMITNRTKQKYYTPFSLS